MKDVTKSNYPNRSNKNPLMVMFLSHPPDSGKTEDWYWTNVAGVPFLLRNLLNIQKAGGRELILSASPSAQAQLAKRIGQDARVELNLEWISDPKQILPHLEACETVLLLDGRVLFQPKDIQQSLSISGEQQDSTNFQTALLEPENMVTLLEKLDGLLVQGTPFNETAELFISPPGKTTVQIRLLQTPTDSTIRHLDDFAIQHKRLLNSCGLNNDSLMDRMITRLVSRQLTRLFLGSSITPNQITLLSLLFGLASGACFYSGSYRLGLAGAGLLVISAWIDCTDGEIARLKFLESKLGKQLDIYSDNIVHVTIFFAIGMGATQATGQKLYLLFGGLAVLGTLISFTLLNTSIMDKKSAGAQNQVPESLQEQIANRDFIYLILLMAIVGKLHWFIILAGAGSNLFASYALYTKYKQH